MLLSDVLDALTAERPVEPVTEGQYSRSIRCFGAFLCRPAATDDLVADPVNAWLRSLERGGRMSSTTVQGRKRGLTPVWRYASERGWSGPYDGTRLRRIRTAPGCVSAWPRDQVVALLRACDDLPGRLRCGIGGGDLMRAVIWMAYETGMRPSDWRRLRWSNVDMRARVVRWVQHKTRQVHVAAIGPQTVASLVRIQNPERDRIVPLDRDGVRRWQDKLIRHARQRHEFRGRKGQSIGTLRKSHGTEVCKSRGLEAAAQSLGHISGTAIARRYYVEPDVLQQPQGPPPLLDDPTDGSGRTADQAGPTPHR